MTIGICDYGIGGIGLYRLLREATTVDIVYVSDAGYKPYGVVTETELRSRLEAVIQHFNSLGIHYIAVACNSASTVIPETNTITGILEHGINMVLKVNPDIVAVVGGVRTIESDLYRTAFEQRGIRTVQHVAQQLSKRIEAGDVESADLDEEIRSIFEPIKEHEYILLACTHYPVIAARIRSFARQATLLDPAEEMSQWILANWPDLTGNSQTRWMTTGDTDQMKLAVRRAYDIEIDRIEKLLL